MRILAMITVAAGLVSGGTTGKLTGTVKDKNDNTPLAGCNIVILNTDLGTASDPSGEFTILNIAPGVYSVKTMMIGYQSVTVTQIPISVDKTFRLNLSMDVQAVEGKEIIVVADRGVIQFDRTNSESRVTSDVLETMPLTEVSDVIKLQGGITQDEGGGIHIRGGRGSEIVYMVDGMSMTDVYDGGISVTVENDNIQELQVISGNFNAEKWLSDNVKFRSTVYGRQTIAEYDGSSTVENGYEGDNLMYAAQFGFDRHEKDLKDYVTFHFHRYDREYDERGTIDTYESEVIGLKYDFSKTLNETISFGLGSGYKYGWGYFDNNGSSYSSSTKGNIVLNYLKIDSTLLSFICDQNTFKLNKITPGSRIMIISKNKMRSMNCDYLFVLIWPFRKEVIKQEITYIKNGGKLIFPLPMLHIVDKSNYKDYLKRDLADFAFKS